MPISFPFRINPVTRSVETVVSGSDEEVDEAIAAHIMTMSGERPMRPDFGTPALPFSNGLDAGALQVQLNTHGWDYVNISDVDNNYIEGGKVESTVRWERNHS